MKFCCSLKKVVDDSYDIEIDGSLQDKLVSDIAGGLMSKANRYVVITDSTVKDLYAEPILGKLRSAGLTADLVYIPAGEKSKTRRSKELIEDEMLRLGCRRDCGVIAVGGGVVTDLAGFVAGTFGRGVPFVNYATTLLAAADASIGGKTAVDTPLATNLIGLFNQPKKVYIDTDSWKTLPRREISSGLAETIKHAVMADKDLFSYLEENIEKVFDCEREVCSHIANENCRIKYTVVIKDERESGLREILNLGHTVGRAVETVSDYRLTHGEAVAIGLCAEARLAIEYGFADGMDLERMEALLRRAELPTAIPDYIDREALVKKLYTDKKVRNGKLRFVFQSGIGDIRVFENESYAMAVPEEDARAVIMKM